MTRKVVDNSVEDIQPHEDHWLGQWACSLSVILFLIAFGLSGQMVPRCTAEQGMCTPGECTCPFPLMKRDLVTQDAQACSQCVEEFCPAVVEGDPACSTAACDCEDPSWSRIDVGTPEKPCMQCVHPHVDVTLRREGDNDCLDFGENRTCTVFRYNGAAMLDKTSNRSSCLTWSNGDWQLTQCQGTPGGSAKFTQRSNKDEALTKGTFCTSRGKQCLHIKEYMCKTDPSQCSTEMCRCEDPSHVRKELQTVDRSTCYLCTPVLPECPVSPAACSSEPCECKPGFFKAPQNSDESCFSCQPETVPSVTGLTSILTLLSAAATFLLCIALVAVVGCAIRGSIVGDPAPTKRKRRGSQARRKVVAFLDACDAALDPVYFFFEACLDRIQNAINVGIDKAKKLIGMGQTESTKTVKPKRERETDRQGHNDVAKEHFVPRAAHDRVGAKGAGERDQSISWDPINVNVSNEEWMNYVIPNVSAQRQARYARNEPPPPDSAVQRLRQRREAKAQAAAEKATAQAASVTEVEVDESWIDAMEEKEAKEKEAKEKAAWQRRERKQAAKARRAKVAAGGPQEAENDEVEETTAPATETSESENKKAKVEEPRAADTEGPDMNPQDEIEEPKAEVVQENPKAKEKAAAQRKERKQTAKARRAKVAAGGPQEAENDDVEETTAPATETSESENKKAKVEEPRAADTEGPAMKRKDEMEKPKAEVVQEKPKVEGVKPEKREKRAWSEVVAPWAKRTEVISNLGAGAPEFVPLAQQLQELGVHDSSELGITTVRVSGLSPDTTATGLFRQLDLWGLGGSFDFLHIMSEADGSAYANINFIDPVFVSLFCCLCQEYQLPADISVSEVQGIKALTAQWVQSGDRIQAVVIRNAMPSQWAVNAVNTMLSPQLKGQFRKTKRCVNHKKNRCDLGADCPFAHSEEELMPMPDLAKTKMCYNYFRRRCNDPTCKFAHGFGELRSVWTYPMWPVEVMQGFDFSQPQAYPTDMCYMQEESQGDAFSAERPAAPDDSEQGDSILFEALPKDEGTRPVLDYKVALRVRRTFMEVTQVEDMEDDDDDMPIGTSMRRSFSDSHLETLKEAMEEDTEL